MKKPTVTGRNIFQDDKGRNILYNFKTKTGYIIQEKDERAYRLYANRYVILIIMFVLLINFIKNLYLVFGLLLILGIMLEYSYRKRFIPSLTCIQNMKPFKKLSPIDSLVELGDKKRCLFLSIMYLALGILIVINGIQIKLSPFVMAGNVIVAIGAVYFAVINLIAYTKIKKN